MTRAYPKGTVKKLLRTFALDLETNQVTITDHYSFDRKPRKLEEAFITFEDVAVGSGGRSVQIGSKSKGITLTTATKGKFSVVTLTEESKEGRADEPIRRITFVPAALDRNMEISFTVE